MSARNALGYLYQDRPDRVGRDRLEILTALINGPSFDPTYRPDIIKIPRTHPVYQLGLPGRRLRTRPVR
ncbi:MAG: hypothetical protein WAN20_03315 [Pseudonocardiaceae bacterium]